MLLKHYSAGACYWSEKLLLFLFLALCCIAFMLYILSSVFAMQCGKMLLRDLEANLNSLANAIYLSSFETMAKIECGAHQAGSGRKKEHEVRVRRGQTRQDENTIANNRTYVFTVLANGFALRYLPRKMKQNIPFAICVNFNRVRNHSCTVALRSS